MSKPHSPESIHTKCSNLEVGKSESFEGKKPTSAASIVSQLKKHPDHSEKKFKIASVNNTVTVTRLK